MTKSLFGRENASRTSGATTHVILRPFNLYMASFHTTGGPQMAETSARPTARATRARRVGAVVRQRRVAQTCNEALIATTKQPCRSRYLGHADTDSAQATRRRVIFLHLRWWSQSDETSAAAGLCRRPPFVMPPPPFPRNEQSISLPLNCLCGSSLFDDEIRPDDDLIPSTYEPRGEELVRRQRRDAPARRPGRRRRARWRPPPRAADAARAVSVAAAAAASSL